VKEEGFLFIQKFLHLSVLLYAHEIASQTTDPEKNIVPK